MKLVTVKPTFVKRGNKIFKREGFGMLRRSGNPKPLISTRKQY
jgi:hypothetical protein